MFFKIDKTEFQDIFVETLYQDLNLSTVYLHNKNDFGAFTYLKETITPLICKISFETYEFVDDIQCQHLTEKHVNALITKLNTKVKTVQIIKVPAEGMKLSDNKALKRFRIQVAQNQIRL